MDIELTKIQKEVLTGLLLGDGSIGFSSRQDSVNPRLYVGRQISDLNYLKYQYSLFREYCSSGITKYHNYDSRYNTNYRYCKFVTRSLPIFLNYYNIWYINNKRQVPENLELTPLVIATWFSDDGCVINNSNNVLTVKFSTESFGIRGVEILSSKLEKKYNVKFPIYKKLEKDQYIIKISTIPSRLIIKDIEPYVISMGMERKASIWKNTNIKSNLIAGRFPKESINLYILFLKLKDFKFSDLIDINYGERRIRKLLSVCYNNKYLSKSVKNNNVYYSVTDLGYTYFSEFIENNYDQLSILSTYFN